MSVLTSPPPRRPNQFHPYARPAKLVSGTTSSHPPPAAPITPQLSSAATPTSTTQVGLQHGAMPTPMAVALQLLQPHPDMTPPASPPPEVKCLRVVYPQGVPFSPPVDVPSTFDVIPPDFQLNEREQANAAEGLASAHAAIVFLRRLELYNYTSTPWGAPLDAFPLRVKQFIAWYWQCKTKDIAIWTWYMFCRWYHRRRQLGVDPYGVGDPPPEWFTGKVMPDEQVVGYVEKHVTGRRVREAIGLFLDEDEEGEEKRGESALETASAAGESDGASEASSTEDTGDLVDGEETLNEKVVPVPPTPVVLPPTPPPAVPLLPHPTTLPPREVIDLTVDTPPEAPPTPVPQPTLDIPAANPNPMEDFIASLALGPPMSMEDMELFAAMLGNSGGDGIIDGAGQLETSLSGPGNFAGATSQDGIITSPQPPNDVPLQPEMVVPQAAPQPPLPPSQTPVQASPAGPAPQPVHATSDTCPIDSAQLIAEKNAALQQAAEMQRKIEILEQEKCAREKAEEVARQRRNAQSSHTRRVRKQKAREKEAAEAAAHAEWAARAMAAARTHRVPVQYMAPAPVPHVPSPALTPGLSQYSPNGYSASPALYHPQGYAVAGSPFPGTPVTMADWSRPVSRQQYRWQATGPASNYSGSGAGTPYPK